MRSLPEIFFFAIVFYVLYRFIFNFVVPIARTTRQVRQQFRNMQEGAGQSYNEESRRNEAPTPERKPNTDKVGEYIDFEEVK
jgi:hypothetical protein